MYAYKHAMKELRREDFDLQVPLDALVNLFKFYFNRTDFSKAKMVLQEWQVLCGRDVGSFLTHMDLRSPDKEEVEHKVNDLYISVAQAQRDWERLTRLLQKKITLYHEFGLLGHSLEFIDSPQMTSRNGATCTTSRPRHSANSV